MVDNENESSLTDSGVHSTPVSTKEREGSIDGTVESRLSDINGPAERWISENVR